MEQIKKLRQELEFITQLMEEKFVSSNSIPTRFVKKKLPLLFDDQMTRETSISTSTSEPSWNIYGCDKMGHSKKSKNNPEFVKNGKDQLSSLTILRKAIGGENKMGFRINTNVASLQGQNTLKNVSREIQESSAKLSSGERITKAADDASGLAISEKLKAGIRSGKQASRNANDGISLVQVAEGGLNESSSILTRMRELAIQAANDTLSDNDRAKTDVEYQQLKEELDRIAQSTSYNGKKLIDGNGEKLDIQVGIRAGSNDNIISFNAASVNASIDALGISSLHIRSKDGAQGSLDRLDHAISKISAQRSTIGSIQNRLISSTSNMEIYTQNMSDSNSRIRDTDFALETANQAKNTIISNAGTAVLAQANALGQGALSLIG